MFLRRFHYFYCQKMKRIYLLFLLGFSVQLLIGQEKVYTGYFTKDTISNIGFNVILIDDAENAKYCHIGYETHTEKMGPEEIDEYGAYGRVFIAKHINYKGENKHVFLERLANGKIILFRYVSNGNDLYFYSYNGDDLIPLPKKTDGTTYKEEIRKLTDSCPEMNNLVYKRLSYKPRPMAKTFSLYNLCTKEHIPYVKMGILFSVGIHKNSLTNAMQLEGFKTNPLADLTYPMQPTALVGAFVDLPIHFTPHSFRVEVLMHKYTETYSANNQIYFESFSMSRADIKLDINTTCIQVPIMYRYTQRKMNKRLYGNIGFNLGYTLIDNSNLAYYYPDGGISPTYKQVVEEFLVGVTGGLGMEFDALNKMGISAGARYTMTGLSNNQTFIQHFITLDIGVFLRRD